ncbi:MAG: CapA family protein [bacterium]|nr:CapA family protein [bacterium]
MKKRKLKKSVKIFFAFILIIIILILILLKEDKNDTKNSINNKDSSKKTEEKSNSFKKLSLLAVGDVLIHESVYKDAYINGTYDFHKMFEDIEPIIKKYDLKFCNQESTIGGNTLGISGYPSFNSPDEIGDEIVNLGFNLISLANNHALDKGVDAVMYSNSFWKTKNVVTSGAYSTKDERDDIKVYEKNGIKYAFLAYTTLSNNNIDNDYIINMYDESRVKSDIEKIKDKTDLIIVSMHWGEEYTNTPTQSQRQIAQYLSSLGVNIIIGHHPHVVQPVEYIDSTLVIYSLGNFISNQLVVGVNEGTGLILGIDIILDDDGIHYDNIYKELILSYSDNSTNFKVIPFSNLNNDLLYNYKSIEEKYMKIVNNE